MKLGMFAAGAASGAAQGYMIGKMKEKLETKKPDILAAPKVTTPNSASASDPAVGANDPDVPVTIGAEGAQTTPSESAAPSNPIAQAEYDQAKMAGYFRQFAGPNYGQG